MKAPSIAILTVLAFGTGALVYKLYSKNKLEHQTDDLGDDTDDTPEENECDSTEECEA